MNDPASAGRTPVSARRGAAWRAARAVLRTTFAILFGLGVIWLSIVASVWGLSAVLVVLALVGLVVLRTAHRAQTEHLTPAARRPHRAFVITGVVLIGFFVLLTLASQIWASH